MSLRYEQYRSLKMTRDLLSKILTSKHKDLKISELKKIASKCVHHFPLLNDDGKPIFSKDDLTDD